MTDLYAVLGVPSDAGIRTIKAAYRALAKQHHPDAGGDPAKFHQIQSAYDVLSDSDKRGRYDTTGEFDDAQQENPDAEALATLNGLLSALLQRPDRWSLDLLSEMRKALRDARQDLAHALSGVEQSITAAEKVRAQLKRESDGSAIVEHMLDREIERLTIRADECRSRDDMMERAVALLAPYRMEGSEQPKPRQFFMDLASYPSIGGFTNTTSRGL